MTDMRNNNKRRNCFRSLWMLVFAVLIVSHFLILDRMVAWFDDDGERSSLGVSREMQGFLSSFTELTRRSLDSSTLHLQVDTVRSSFSAKSKATISTITSNASYDHNTNNTTTRVSLEDPSIVKLRDQGIDNPENQTIPTWSQITDLYGDKPVILGLETCKAYRQAVPNKERRISPAGMFNTGTNLFSAFFNKNCVMQDNRYNPLQVPWGKHNLAQARLDNYTVNKTHYLEILPDHVLPVVMVRHPISWMFSTCVHSYGAHWPHDADEKCPHLIRENNQNESKLVPVRVQYGYNPPSLATSRGKRHFTLYKSLIHVWRHWYQDYVDNFPFPRLIVRLEDVIYHPEQVLTEICSCVGGATVSYNLNNSNNTNITNSNTTKIGLVPAESVKIYRDRIAEEKGRVGTLVKGRETAGLLKAWISHASIASLWKKMTPGEQRLVQQVLLYKNNKTSNHRSSRNGKSLLELFHYKISGFQ